MLRKLSIITINFNNQIGLKNTIESVVSQTFTDYEYIVIDGGSTDKSVDIIKQYSDKISYWVSEQDAGIYNAMNKGIKKATGEYCLFLNSGDCLFDKTSLNQAFSLNPVSDIVCFYEMFVKDEIEEIHTYPDEISFYYFYQGSLCHQSLFYKRVLFEKHGFYNEDFKVVSDWAFNIQSLIINNCSYHHYPLTFVKYNFEGLCVSEDGLKINHKEREQVLSSLFQKRILNDYENFKTFKENKVILKLTSIKSDFLKSLLFQILRVIKKIDSII